MGWPRLQVEGRGWSFGGMCWPWPPGGPTHVHTGPAGRSLNHSSSDSGEEAVVLWDTRGWEDCGSHHMAICPSPTYVPGSIMRLSCHLRVLMWSEASDHPPQERAAGYKSTQPRSGAGFSAAGHPTTHLAEP